MKNRNKTKTGLCAGYCRTYDVHGQHTRRLSMQRWAIQWGVRLEPTTTFCNKSSKYVWYRWPIIPITRREDIIIMSYNIISLMLRRRGYRCVTTAAVVGIYALRPTRTTEFVYTRIRGTSAPRRWPISHYASLSFDLWSHHMLFSFSVFFFFICFLQERSYRRCVMTLCINTRSQRHTR